MKLLGLLIVRCGISALLLAGAIACKETEGFQAVELQEPSSANGVAKFGNAQLTPQASSDIQARLRELKDIEDEMAIKAENIGKMRLDIENLQEALESSNQVNLENQVSNEELQSLNERLEESVANAKAQEQELLNKLKDLVKELAKFETTEAVNALREEVSSRLSVYEADKTKIAADIAEREQTIETLKNEIAAMKDPAQAAAKQKLEQDLIRAEEELLGLTDSFKVSEELAQLSSCATDPSACSEEILDDVIPAVPTGDERLSTVELSESIKGLNAEKEGLQNIIKQIDQELVMIQKQIAIVNSSTSQTDVSSRISTITQLNKSKLDRVKEKSDATEKLKEINRQISSKARIITSR